MILIDNTVLSNFAFINQPEFIRHGFIEEVGTTDMVFSELKIGVKLGHLPA
jgi:hypothetical protein